MARVVTMLMPSGFLFRQCVWVPYFFLQVKEERNNISHTQDRRKLKKRDDMRDDVLCNSSALLR
jgi:hypothetical protein